VASADQLDDLAEAIGNTPSTYRHDRLRTYRSTSTGGMVRVLGAATSRPGLRPNTADTYALFVHLANPTPDQQGLAVTTQAFVPFQTFDAFRKLSLPTGAGVEVVGAAADRRNLRAIGVSDHCGVEQSLQEVLSGLRSARRLMCELVVRLAS
jgi:hypothetical protein